MNELKTVSISILRQLITGFFFTSGGLLAVALFHRFLHIGLCP